jgi:hypothetical protein
MTITLTYRSRRAEVWRWYARAWSRPRGLWRVHLGFLVGTTALVLWQRSSTHQLDARDLAIALAFGMFGVAFLTLWPQLRFKPQDRLLTLDEQGAHTVIGSQSGSVPWADVATIEVGHDVIAITGTNGNAFLIPSRAFSSVDERTRVAGLIESWHRGARRLKLDA